MDKHIATLEFVRNHTSRTSEEIASLDAAIALMRGQSEPDYWFVMYCPGWPGGYALDTKEAALQFIRENGDDNTQLASWHDQYQRRDYTRAELREMLDAKSKDTADEQ